MASLKSINLGDNTAELQNFCNKLVIVEVMVVRYLLCYNELKTCRFESTLIIKIQDVASNVCTGVEPQSGVR
ncbi:unnamed protein product [Tenebrio molitor]|nr:unnamed protein product [Tenebrio molitor]